MEVGENIAARRKELGLTQEQLGDKIGVTKQAVSDWERGRTNPDIENYELIAKALETSVKRLVSPDSVYDNWVIKDAMFSSENMANRLIHFCENESLTETFHAIEYVQEKMGDQKRNPNRHTNSIEKRVPAVTHPFLMACHAHAIGIHDDATLAAILLHDVCEDAGVEPKELPFSDPVKTAVGILTKHKGQETREYYAAIQNNAIAAIVKVIDRCNNVSTMAPSFSRDRLIKYVNETEEYVYPLAEYIKKHYLQYSDQVFIIKYQMMSIIETVKAMLMDYDS